MMATDIIFLTQSSPFSRHSSFSAGLIGKRLRDYRDEDIQFFIRHIHATVTSDRLDSRPVSIHLYSHGVMLSGGRITR